MPRRNDKVASSHKRSDGKVVVTGAGGFIGSRLCGRLRELGERVNGISRTKHGGDQDLCWRYGDLADVATAREFLTSIEPDVIFHLAGHVKGARGLDLVLPTFRSNLMSTVNVLTVASEIGCRRVVLVGSLEEPEGGDSQEIPSSPYAVSKWAASAYGRMFHALYQLPVVILRMFMVYGPAHPNQEKLIPYSILSLLRGEVPKLAGGERKIDWIYIDDAVEGLVAAAQASSIEGKTIDIGSGDPVAIQNLVEYLVRRINPKIKPCFGALRDRPMEQVRVADTATAKVLLGWEPTTPLEEGLNLTVDWYEGQLRESAGREYRKAASANTIRNLRHEKR